MSLDIKEFEDCVELGYDGYSNVYDWFINQDHIPFDMSSDAHVMYYTLYVRFLDDLYKLYSETGDQYYWYNKGNLVSDKGSYVISSNSILVNKSKIREYKINQLLN